MPTDTPFGTYAGLTKTAVTDFQKIKDLYQDGKVGKDTWKKLSLPWDEENAQPDRSSWSYRYILQNNNFYTKNPEVTLINPAAKTELEAGESIKITAKGTNCHHLAVFINGEWKKTVFGENNTNTVNLEYDYVIPAVGKYNIQVKGRNIPGNSGVLVGSEIVEIEGTGNPNDSFDWDYGDDYEACDGPVVSISANKDVTFNYQGIIWYYIGRDVYEIENIITAKVADLSMDDSFDQNDIDTIYNMPESVIHREKVEKNRLLNLSAEQLAFLYLIDPDGVKDHLTFDQASNNVHERPAALRNEVYKLLTNKDTLTYYEHTMFSGWQPTTSTESSILTAVRSDADFMLMRQTPCPIDLKDAFCQGIEGLVTVGLILYAGAEVALIAEGISIFGFYNATTMYSYGVLRNNLNYYNSISTAPAKVTAYANIKNPNARHYAKKVVQGSNACVPKVDNTVIEPWVDVNADIQAIKSGQIQPVNGQFTVNGRIYAIHNGAFHPVSGQGLHYLDRGGYQALSVYNKFGLTSQAEGILDNMKVTVAARSAAQEIWRLIQ